MGYLIPCTLLPAFAEEPIVVGDGRLGRPETRSTRPGRGYPQLGPGCPQARCCWWRRGMVGATMGVCRRTSTPSPAGQADRGRTGSGEQQEPEPAAPQGSGCLAVGRPGPLSAPCPGDSVYEPVLVRQPPVPSGPSPSLSTRASLVILGMSMRCVWNQSVGDSWSRRRAAVSVSRVGVVSMSASRRRSWS